MKKYSGATSAEPGSWIEAGRSFQRFALTAEKLGLSLAHHNAPLQVPALREQLSQLFCAGFHPALLLRIGYATRQAQSPRRAVHEFYA